MNKNITLLWKFGIDFFSKGQKRTVEAKKNILASFFIKGIGILISLILVPITINYVNPTQYGIWLTLSSVVAWFGFFDIGFGNGLRNRFAEAKALGNQLHARIYISTTYAVLIIIFIIVWLVFFLTNQYLDWSKILNAPEKMAMELSKLALIIFSFFCLQMIFQTISTILIADQKPAISAFLNLLSQMLSLVIIIILTKITQGSLCLLGLTLGFATTFILIISTFWIFNGYYKELYPSLKYVDFSYAKDIMQIGYKFFFIQIAVLILFQSSNIIIAQLFGPDQVTSYNIAYKYFGIVPMIFNIIITPFWSASTDAWVKKDLYWIKTTVKKLQYIWIIFAIGTFTMLALSGYFYSLWIGNEIKIHLSISIALAFYVVINSWVSIFSYFINGIGKIQLQLYSAVWCSLINIPLAIFLGRTFGVSGVILSTIILSLINSIWITIQYNKLINNTAKNIWAK